MKEEVEKGKVVTTGNKSIRKKKKLSPEEKKKRLRRRRFKNTIFFFVWLYILTSIFFTSIDSIILSFFLIQLSLAYILIKFLCIGMIFFLIWLKIGNLRFWKNIGLFFAYPFYPLAWKLIVRLIWKTPKRLIKKKRFVALYYYLETLVDFFYSFKRKIISGLLFILGIILLVVSEGYLYLIPIFIFSLLQVAHLVKRFNQTFSPLKVFKISLDDLERVDTNPISPEELDKLHADQKKHEKLSEEEKKIKGMEYFLIINELAEIINLKIKEVISRRVYMFSFLSKTIYSFLIAIFYFGSINYCLYNISPLHFKVDFIPSFFDFIYYTFFTIFPEGTDIEALSDIAKLIRMIGAFVGILINLLLLTVFFAITSDRFKKIFERVSKMTDNYSKGINVYFERKFEKSPKEVIEHLSNLENPTVKDLLQFRKFMKT